MPRYDEFSTGTEVEERQRELASALSKPPATQRRVARPYEFPALFAGEGDNSTTSAEALQQRLADHSAKQLVVLMGEAVRKLRLSAPYSDEAEKYRRAYCVISRILNARRTIAPAFRPRLKSKRLADRNEHDNLHQIDRAIIDLEWLHLNGHPPLYRRAFDESVDFDDPSEVPDANLRKFNFHIAAWFAQLGWKTKIKVQELRLPVIHQIELSALRSDRVRDLLRNAQDEAECLRAQIQAEAKYLPQFASDTNVWPELLVAVRLWSFARKPSDPALQFAFKPLASLIAAQGGVPPRDARNLLRSVERLIRYWNPHASKPVVRLRARDLGKGL